jgi:fatty-acyl-CoA synthase
MLAGLMQPVPFTLNLVRERVATLFPNKVVTSRYLSRVTVATYGEVVQRALQVFFGREG